MRRRALVFLACAAVGCASDAPLPSLGNVPSFTLQERHGRVVTDADLRGQVWIANFIFTRCPDVCPALSAGIAGLQQKVPGGDDPVRLLSITVDPHHDTAEVLRAYAERFTAGPAWWFVTGPRDAIASLLRDGFHVAFADDGPPTAPITHSDRFVLVDRTLAVRGFYHGRDADDVARLVHDVARVHAERTPH